jgi:hypothetical protein
MFSIKAQYRDCLSRQVGEAIGILHSKDDLLNSKSEYLNNCLTRITISEKDWERKERERLEDEAEKQESARIESFRLEKMNQIQPSSPSIPGESHESIPGHGDMGARYPSNQPNMRVSDPSSTEKKPPKTTSSLLEENTHPSIHTSEGGVGARHPRNKPNTRVPGQTMEALELLSDWWKAIETDQTRKERKKSAIAARPAIRNARKFSRKKASTQNSLAWWTVWWLRMERNVKLSEETNSLKKNLINTQHQKSKDDTCMKPKKRMTPSKRCLQNKLDSPAKRFKHNNFCNLLQFLGGGAASDDVTSERNLNTTEDQLVDSGGGGTEMESYSPV